MTINYLKQAECLLNLAQEPEGPKTDKDCELLAIGYALIAIAEELQKANGRKVIPLPPDPDCTCGSSEPPGPAHREGCPSRIPF